MRVPYNNIPTIIIFYFLLLIYKFNVIYYRSIQYSQHVSTHTYGICIRRLHLERLLVEETSRRPAAAASPIAEARPDPIPHLAGAAKEGPRAVRLLDPPRPGTSVEVRPPPLQRIWGNRFPRKRFDLLLNPL